MQLIPVGDDFEVRSNADEYSVAYQPIQLVGGRVLTLWTEYSWAGHSSGSGYVMGDVYARLYEADGTAVGSQFRVNASDLSTQAEPSATALDDGGFLVAWQTYASGTTYLNPPIIVATRYDANGAAQTGEFSVASAVGEGVESAELTNLGNGTLMLTYTEDQPYPNNSILKGVILNATGVPTGTPFEIGSAKFYSDAQSMAVLSNGNVMAIWSGEDSDSMGIYARVLSPTGTPVTGPIQVNTDQTSQQTYPETAVLTDGSVIVVWQDGTVGDYNDVNARRMAADGSFLSDPFVVETIHTGGDQSRPNVIALADGGYLVAWQTGDTWGEYDVVARRYDANSQPIDIETTLSSDAGGPEGFAPQLLELQDGRIAAFWEAYTWGGTSDMVMRLFEAQTFGTADGNSIRGAITDDWIDGLAGDDLLRGDGGDDMIFGSAGQDTLAGNDGDDVLRGGDDSDLLFGGNDNDDLDGEGGADSVNGGLGDDMLRGGAGNDTLDGESGSDTLAGNDGDDILRGGLGSDRLFGGTDNDDLNGEDGDDFLFGGTGADMLRGGDGNDSLVGESGADTLAGNAGNDTLRGGDDTDALFGGDGNDDVNGDAGADVVNGGLGNDILRGGTGNDELSGASGADTLAGNSGDDTLFGGNDNDRLIGGAGQDMLSGGSGADVFVFNSVSESEHGALRDTITDFESGVDMIDLSGIAPGLSFVGSSYTGTAGEVRYNDAIGRLYIDIDGDLASDFSIDILGASGIDTGDLIL